MTLFWIKNCYILILFTVVCSFLFIQESFAGEVNILDIILNNSSVTLGQHNDTLKHLPNSGEVSHKNRTKLRTVPSCQTPNNDTGWCMPIKNCTVLMVQLPNIESHVFLRKSLCGPLDKQRVENPRVCCGKYGNYAHLVNPLPETCGYQNSVMKSRILGGKKAALGEFPWMARLIHRHRKTHAKSFGCSGFLIAPQYVLTAGHCLKSENVDILGPIYQVQLGEHNTETQIDCNSSGKKCADKPQVIRIKKNIPHPKYDMSSENHHDDIGLIHLKKPANFTNFVAPICLFNSTSFVPFEYWISGWGKTTTQTLSSIKMKLSVPPYLHLNCSKLYRTIGMTINKKQICAGGQKNKDTCTGDSGGPLMVAQETHWFATGVVSYGWGCGQQGWPGVYTNVTSYLEWIKEKIRERDLFYS